MARETGQPQIVKLDMAFKLASALGTTKADFCSFLLCLAVMVHAEKWVNDMSKATEDESAETASEGRQPRLGLGAKVARRSSVPLNDPVARKLHSKINAGKRKNASIAESLTLLEKDESDDDNELESRTRAFDKKQAVPLAPSLQAKKKQK